MLIVYFWKKKEKIKVEEKWEKKKERIQNKPSRFM